MIHHVSISARNPKHVASVLAELMGGGFYPFPGSIPDSYMAISGDEHGTMVEVYPADVTLRPGRNEEDQVAPLRGQASPETVPFHFMLSVPIDHGTIMRIGEREGWRTQLCGRGAPGQEALFYVVELWLENRLMAEIVPEEMMDAYRELIQIPVMNELFGYRNAA